jgi:gluconate 5-dehydrogenase
MGSRLEGRCGVITGAAGGLGGSFARAFADEGASVALWDLHGAQELADTLEGASSTAVDITDPDQVHEAMAGVRERFGQLDFLVNNAGVRTEVPFLEQTVEDWRRTLEVNLTGTFICAQAAGRIMARQGSGKIVNIASIAGLVAFTGRPAYVASKAGVMGLTRAIAAELGPHGVNCNAIAPGIFETPMTTHYFQDEALAETIRQGTPSRRWGRPQELTGAAVYLSGPDSDFVQGQTIVVDGGWTITKGY